MTAWKQDQSVAWECPACGHRHRWRWSIEDTTTASYRPAYWYCDKCNEQTMYGLIVRIGRNAWAALWGDK